MVRLSRSIPLALLVTVMLASSAAAQLRGFRMPPSLENMGLLGMNAVQEELKVTPEQNSPIVVPASFENVCVARQAPSRANDARSFSRGVRTLG